MSVLKKILNLLKLLFDVEEKADPVPTNQGSAYANITITDAGNKVIEGGKRYYLDPEEINFMLALETDLLIKSEIRSLIKEKEAAGINVYSFETKLGRYEIVNGTFKRYPKT